MPRIESSKRRYARRTTQRFKAWLIQKNRKARQEVQQVVEKICRYFSTFDGSSSYAALTDEIILSGDFEIEIKINTTDSSADILKGDSDLFYKLVIIAGEVWWLIGDGVIWQKQIPSNVTVNDGLDHFITTLYKNDRLIIKIDGQEAANVFESDQLIPKLSDLGDGLIGTISDLKIWSGGDRTTGNLILDLPMSEGLKDVYDEVFYRNRVQAQAEWLLNLDGGYVEYQPITLSGDFEIEVKIKTYAVPASNMFAIGGDGNATQSDKFTIYLDTGGDILAQLPRLSSAAYVKVSHTLNADSILTLVKSGNTVTIQNENGSSSTTQADFFDFKVVFLGRWSSTNFNGQLSNLKIWQNGDRTTGTLIIDSALDDNSNIITNAASPVNANVWSGTVTATGESSGDIDSVNVLSTAGASSQVSVPATIAGDDVLIQATLSAGSLDNIIAGDSTTEFTGWQNIRDNDGQPTNRYQTIMNNNDNEVVFKVSGIADATLSEITARVVEGYGVLQGTRNTDYNWTNETPHAIGYNVTTEEVCEGTAWVDSELWYDGEQWND